MKTIKVNLKSKTQVELLEDANKGDIIDLEDVQNIDLSNIERLINDGTDQVYNKKLEEVQKQLQDKFDLELKNRLLSVEQSNKDTVFNLQETINNLNNQIQSLKDSSDAKVLEATSKLREEITKLEADMKIAEANKQVEIEKASMELTKTFEAQIQLVKQDRDAAVANYESLKNFRNNKTSKLVGEDLETWCNQQVNELMQIGFSNCTWEKDNTSVKEENEIRGTKADYIFKIYASNSHKEEEELSSVCLEMKNEYLESDKKKKDKDHFDKLDKDRIKKNCKYALLVSNLEQENINILPIYKVVGYEDMYVVRPQYMRLFLTIITTLSNKYSEILINHNIEKLSLQSKQELLDQFEDIKQSYLGDQLETLSEEIAKIDKNADDIISSATKIKSNIDNITVKYINKISDKLDKFSARLNTEYRKYEKTEKGGKQ